MRRVVHRLGLAVVLGAALSLAGCGEDTYEGDGSLPDADRGGATASLTSRPDAVQTTNAEKDHSAARPPPEQTHREDPPPPQSAEPQEPDAIVDVFVTDPTVTDEALQDPDPNMRIWALEAWVQQPGASLNPVTYALVDPDESVRARAQELFEQELEAR
jgi:hypothetical protein